MKNKSTLFAIITLITLVIFIACKKEAQAIAPDEEYSDTPVLPEQPYDYKISNNDKVAQLGRVLFYDKALSLNNSVACASCHQQTKGFCDNQQFSTGLEDKVTRRNSPSIFARSGRMFWDGRAQSMSDLVLKPVKNHVEMRFENVEAMAAKISRIAYYPELFEKAFGSKHIDTNRIQIALAEFLRNFDFSNNKFVRSRMKMESLNASEKLGENIFFGKGQCFNCHHITPSENNFFPMDTLPPSGYGDTDENPSGAAGVNIGLDLNYADNGSGELTGNPEDNGKFMLPVLFNVEYTSPYMHDGRFKTLEEVVEHYNSGIKDHPNLDIRLRNIDLNNLTDQDVERILLQFDVNKNGDLDPEEIRTIPPRRLNLTANEKRNLVDFLRTLSDPSMLRDVKFSNPFAVRK